MYACAHKLLLTAANGCAENSLMRTESGKERLRLEAEASRAEIWAKIQAAKTNSGQRQRVSDPAQCTDDARWCITVGWATAYLFMHVTVVCPTTCAKLPA